MPGSCGAAAVGVLTILLLSQGPPCCWAEAPAGQEGAAQSPAKHTDWDPITKLLAWIQQNEGQVDLEVGPVDESGLRGTVAQRDMKKFQVAVKIKNYMTIPLGEWNKSSEENALVLLKRKLGDAEWDKVMGPYWNSLPRPEDVRTKETFPPSKLSLLQDPSMAAFVRVHQDFTRNVLRGAKPHIVKDVREHLGKDLSLDNFKYWTALVASYAFTFPEEGNPDKQMRVMLPLMDLINHGNEEEANLKLFRDDQGDYIAFATRDIKKGEQLLHTYNGGCARNDHSLFHYGFVQEHVPVPSLAAQDLPGGNLYDESAHNDADYDEGGLLVTREELQRLGEILAGFPTTEAEDERLLQGGSWVDRILGRKPLTDDLERLFVKYRMLRKKALRFTIEKLRTNLAAADAEL